ncbi:MAG: inorganic phosphate transporter [Bacteroidales bacterium]|nr:inorganic phosphate transporter [Bacteroidales bacterium]MDD4821278.1 inorganic phosphate transporter [Bacteroidales bacterium]
MELFIIIVILAVIFDYINGFHDAANAIATVVSTKVLSPLQAVFWAAGFNFLAFFICKYIIGEFGIADTVSKTVIPEFITNEIIIAGLIAAITWNLITWRMGIPSSSSHTLIGGFAGAAIAAAGFHSIHTKVIIIIASFIIIAPLIGMITGNLIAIATLHISRKSKPQKADKWFKRLQLLSSAMMSIGHGMNDSQKVMGIIGAAMIANGQLDEIKNIPDWVPITCFAAIAAGTLSGGWRIMKTMGDKITKISPVEGFCAETAGAFTLYLTEYLKVPVSTTHVITGSIIGVGATKRLSAVRWGVTINLVWAWILTIPVSALIAGCIYYLLVHII